ncbi:MAG: UDP-N-acetylmuramate dehydrogenase, partial [Oscillospiraceae bacterium]
MDYSPLDQLCVELDCEWSANEPMSRHTSFKIGGNADRFISVPKKSSLRAIICGAQKWNIPYMILGNGSNVLVGDAGISGAVLCLTGEFREIKLINDTTIHCGAGASLAALCNFAKSNSLSGLEFAFGIPGTAGGAAYMNAGAYGGEMKDVLTACDHVTQDGEIGRFSSEALHLSYRKSAYTDKKYIITDLILSLEKGMEEEISDKMEALLGKRKEKQPLEYPSAGSTFRRPEGYFAAALIEECGLKGEKVGGAVVSTKHSGFIINTGTAT